MNKVIMKLTKIIIILIIINVCFCFSKSMAESEEFKGTRNVIYSIDQSNLANYINGGRENLDISLRKNKPDWLTYKFSAEGRNTIIEFNFSFETYDEYVSKLEELLGYKPAIIRESNKTFVENFSSIELINFLYNNLASEDESIEIEKEELFNVKNSVLQFNETKIETTENISLRNNNVIKFANIQIDTTHNENEITRKISAVINKENYKKEDIEKQFKKVTDKVTINERYNYSLEAEITGKNISEIAEKTMICLNTTDMIQEKQNYLDENKVKVDYIEKFNLKDILEETSRLNYTCTLPDYCTNLASDENAEQKSNINGNKVTYDGNLGIISFSFERAIQFSEISVTTDMSNLFGIITRTIKFKFPIEIVANYNEKFKNEFTEKLQRGMTLNIYNEKLYRVYEITVSSMFLEELNDKTSKFLNEDMEISMEKTINPFEKNKIKDEYDFSNCVKNMLAPDKIESVYVLDRFAKIIDTDDAVIKDKTITFDGNLKNEIKFQYKTFNIVLWSFILVCTIIILIIVMIIVKKVKKNISKKKENKTEE